MIDTDTKSADMLEMAQRFAPDDSVGSLVPMNQPSLPTPSAVFGEPIVVAQPMQSNQRRDINRFMGKMKVMAQMAGEEYRYSFPVSNKDGTKKTIEGGTIKMANDLVREYGNCMVDVRVVEQLDSTIFYARFVDYETGFCLTRAFRQRKGQKTMKTDPERQQDIVFQIGQSKAIRNVVLNALGTFADFTYEEALNSLVEKIGKNLPAWRDKIVKGCGERNYDLKRIEASVGRTITEWLAPDIARVIAELKSIGDGMTSFDDLYPDPKATGTATAADLNKEFNKQDDKPVEAKAEVKKEPAKEPVTAAVATSPATGSTQKSAESTGQSADTAPKTNPETQAVDPTAALGYLLDDLSAAAPETRPAMFVERHGPELLANAKASAKTLETLKSLGIAVPDAPTGQTMFKKK